MLHKSLEAERRTGRSSFSGSRCFSTENEDTVTATRVGVSVKKKRNSYREGIDYQTPF